MKRALVFVACLFVVVSFAGAAGKTEGSAAGGKPVEFVTYGMPHEHVWGALFDAFCAKYNLVHVDTDMSSSEAITKFIAEKNKPIAYATEVGITFAYDAVKRGATFAYKNANWSKIPDWAKDPDGNWFAIYAGVPTMLVAPSVVKNVPHSWKDLLKDEYRKGFAIKDPRTSGTALSIVLSANSALGGDVTNLKPGVMFFKEMMRIGNLSPSSPSDSNIQKGEIPITVKYDHENLILRNAVKADIALDIIVPDDGTLYTPSAIVINRWAPNPDLARKFADFVTSDEGQLLVAKGLARPIRYLAGNLAVPEEIKANWLPDSAYEGKVKVVQDWSAFNQDEFVKLWTTEVSP